MPRTVADDAFGIGDDFLVDDDNVAQSQNHLTVAGLPDGGYVAVWIDQVSYSGSAIKARIFDNAGQPVGDAFVITGAPGDAGGGEPAVAVLESGDFVVTWTVENPYPTMYDIMGRMFDSSGTALGPEFNVSVPVDGFQIESQVTPLAGGGFVATWLYDHQGGIRAQIFDADGDKVGSEFNVNTGAHNYTRDVVGLAGGGFVAAWYDVRAEEADEWGNPSPGVRAQVFAADGSPVGSGFVINTYAPGEQQHPVLAALPDGGFVAAWVDDGDDFGTATGHEGVWLQRFDVTGAKVGAEIEASALRPAGQDWPIIEVIPAKGILVAWRDTADISSNGLVELRAQLYDFSLHKMGEQFVVAANSDGTMFYPDISVLDNGNVVIGWSAESFSPSNEDVRAQILYATVHGTAGDDVFAGTDDPDFIFGHGGDDLIDGGAGIDRMAGGLGNDRYVVDNPGDLIVEGKNQGVDQVDSSISFTLGGNLEKLVLTGSAAIDGTGNGLDNAITGNTNANRLYGGGGNDTLWGENGDDVLDGGAGNDVIRGGDGDDTAVVRGGTTKADTGTEVVDLGINTPGGNEYGVDHLIVDYHAITERVVFSNPSYGYGGASGGATIGGQRRLTFDGVGRLTITTGSGNDLIHSVSVTDVISTGAVNDQIYAFDPGTYATATTRVDGGAGMDVVYSVDWSDLTRAVVLDFNDARGVTIGSGASQRYLRGVESVDGFTTGSGDDAIRLFSSGALQYQIHTGAGSDTVTVYGGTTHTSTGYTFVDFGDWNDGDHLIADFSRAREQVVYTANGSSDAGTSIGGVQWHDYRNVEHVTLTTGAADDIVDARDASPFMWHDFATGAGADLLYGGSGNDRLDGGTGQDSMTGGLGDDVYYVDHAGDVVTEAASAGWDVVYAALDYALTDNVEELFIAGAARNGTGNALANTLRGSASNNTLSGLAGDDTIRGGGGRDAVDGGDGADLIDGGVGKDTLTGGAGRDVFQFRDGDFGATRPLADVITDFSQADREKIHLSLVDANVAVDGNQAFAWIGNGAFTHVAGQLHYAQAGGYTYVEGDTNGDGLADFVIALSGTLGLVASDFVL